MVGAGATKCTADATETASASATGGTESATTGTTTAKTDAMTTRATARCSGATGDVYRCNFGNNQRRGGGGRGDGQSGRGNHTAFSARDAIPFIAHANYYQEPTPPAEPGDALMLGLDLG